MINQSEQNVREEEQGHDENNAETLDGLIRYGLVEREGAVYYVARNSTNLVCNFAVQHVRSGSARYLNGREVPLHQAQVRLSNGRKAIWRVRGSLYDVGAWVEASAGEASIAHPARFKCYLHHRLDRDGIRYWDPQIDVVYCVGTYKTSQGGLRVSDGVDFPKADEECLYSGVTFSRDGSKQVFDQLVALTIDETVQAILVHVLGAPLKPVLGDAYPHLALVGDKEVGKTTIVDAICSRFGIKKVGAPTQFQTPYRRKKTLSNSNVPLFADEVGRLTRSNFRLLCHDLNLAYNVAATTHGSADKIFVLSTPLVMLGQDCPVRDEALLSKLLIYRLKGGCKDPGALEALRASDDVFPFGGWMEFLVAYANGKDLASEVQDKERLLRARVGRELVQERAEVDRCVWNYTTQLVAADVLKAYGLKVDIEDYVAARLVEHLRLLGEAGANVAEQVLADLMALLAIRQGRADVCCDVTQDGLYIHVDSALRTLNAAGYDYEVRDPRTVTRLLVSNGLASTMRHYFGRVRQRCVFISHEKLEELGHKIDPGP